MASAKKAPKQAAKKSAAAKKTAAPSKNRREVYAIVGILAGIYALICCWDTTALLIKPVANFIGGLLGQAGRYTLPLIIFAASAILFTAKGRPVRLRIFCAFSAFVSVTALYHLIVSPEVKWAWAMVPTLYKNGIAGDGGGLFGGFIAMLLELAITRVGAYIVLFVLLAIELISSMNMTINSIITAIKNRPRLPKQESEEEEDAQELTTAERIVNHVANKHIARTQKRRAAEFDLPVDDPPALPKEEKPKRTGRVVSPDAFIEKRREQQAAMQEPSQVTIDEIELLSPKAEAIDSVSGMPKLEKEAPIEKATKAELSASALEVAQEIHAAAAQPSYTFPTLDLLTIHKQNTIDATAEMRENSHRLAETLKSFGIEPHIVNVIRGPSITRYELELDRGVKLSKITNLADDIALSLGASGVRISAIPDKISVVGIEVPNKSVNTVYAREVIGSNVFQSGKSKISFAVGKDISGACIVGDISKLPHMLIAGTTGSGKSVCMNTIIVSLLYKAKPEEVRLIMVDPKMVELGVYNGIAHLLIPVVTDPKKAAGALQWTVTEMMRRYRMMSDLGVRDLESYNKAIHADPDLEPMEQIVVVIDELADLMLVAAKEVEESICRIAQMGRASGIHLLIATQRPSADVITGLMKANIPSRIAFAVSSAMESRIILDTPGAEKLVGKGDMLFAPLGQGKPKRVQGCFITDEEVQAVVNAVKSGSNSAYSQDIIEQIEKSAAQNGKGAASAASNGAEAIGGDELLPNAVEVILETGQASVSMLQRRLKLGYARAARIVDEMEERGIVGPFEGAKPRQLLITREQWTQMQNGTYLPSNPPVEEEL
ncbi:MAG: DNA translocase FtsK [Oscillospiraceae bacterium]|jgi:S-DNA-T family DNA segregation ATPase FtsK/SpoIIIE|nr:DNA translocase FtsK [Oscillospiraceae bacterium]